MSWSSPTSPTSRTIRCRWCGCWSTRISSTSKGWWRRRPGICGSGPRPDVIRTVLDAYAKVQPNLLKHEPGFPEAAALRQAGRRGPGRLRHGRGRRRQDDAGRGADRAGGGIERSAAAVGDACGAGEHARAGVIAGARRRVGGRCRAARVSKLRVYTISDQDDAGPWLRREFPTLHYIATPGDHVDYHAATWTGLAGDEFYRNAPGADWTTVSEAWLNEHVRNKGPLGAYYPLPCCMIEGDTPSFLSLIDNGLACVHESELRRMGRALRLASAVAGDAAVLDEQPRVTRYGDGRRRQDRIRRIRRRSGAGARRSCTTSRRGWRGR